MRMRAGVPAGCDACLAVLRSADSLWRAGVAGRRSARASCALTLRAGIPIFVGETVTRQLGAGEPAGCTARVRVSGVTRAHSCAPRTAVSL